MKRKITIISFATAAIVAGFVASTFAGEEKEEKVSMDQVPAAVKKTLAKYASDLEVKNVEKSDQDGKQVYEFDIEQAGRKFEIAISPKGKYRGMEEDVAFTSMPDSVQKSLTDLADGGKVAGCEKATSAKKVVTYEAEIEKDGKKTEVTVDADGKILTKDSESDEKSEKSEKKEKD